jgi:ABC-2 type transport system permease protein
MTAPGPVVTGLAIRQVRRGALVVLGVCAGMTAVVAASFAGVIADPAAAEGLRSIAGNAAIRTLFGEPVALDHAGGFTVWRVGTVIAILLGVWAILAVTRTTRGAEEARRWDLLLAGRITLRTLTARHVGTVAAAAVLTGAGVTVALLLTTDRPAGALVHGAGIALIGLFCTVTAAFTAQLFAARAAASGTALAVLGVALLLRMTGDGVTALAWLRWLSPLGLLEISSPYGENRAVPLVLLLAVTAAVGVAAWWLAGRRDATDGLLAGTSGRTRDRGLLTGVQAFAVRRLIVPLAAWTAGVVAYFLLIGLTAVTVTDFMAQNSTITEMAGQAGFSGLDRIEGFTAAIFAILAMPVGAFAAVRMSAFCAAEADRRLTLLAAQPVSRVRLLAAETVATAAGMAALVTVAAVATWAGVAAAGGALTVGAALRGTWNALPVALLSLGAAVFAAGYAPRAVAVIGVLPTTGAFLLQVVADSVSAPGWIRNLSPFAHLAPAPLAPIDAAAAMIMLGAGALLVLIGARGYQTRDLSG